MGKRRRQSAPSPDQPAPGATHYETLGITPKATSDQVRRAYRALARQHHPDVSPAPDAAARFAQVQTAYAVLIDPERRLQYDAALSAASSETRPGSAGGAGTAHYTWRNIATEASADDRAGRTDLDDLYDAFFGPRSD